VVDTSWFQILNPFFIVVLAPAFATLWKKTNFSAAQKFSLGLTLLAIGFGLLAFGSSDIPNGATTASISMIWLILAFLFHTLGELAISPVSLSYISKMAPQRMTSFIFGIFFLFTGLSGKFAAALAKNMDSISANSGIGSFFLLLTAIPFIAAVSILFLNKKINKLMHGIQ
jgi:POT family proton-dependent oligopeptide transporter